VALASRQPTLRKHCSTELDTGATRANTARGPLVDEEALRDALTSGHLRGAGLDVFSREPVSPDDSLLELSTLVVTPHLAWLTTETLERSLGVSPRTAVACAPVKRSCTEWCDYKIPKHRREPRPTVGASDQTAETANRLIDNAPPSARDHSANAGPASHGRACPPAGLKSAFLNQARSDCRDPSLALAERSSARVYGVIAEDEVVIVRNG